MNFLKTFFLIISVLFLCGSGYVGDLPELGKVSRNIDPKRPEKTLPVEPLAPKNYTEFKKPVKSKGNYSEYIAKTKDYLLSLKNVRDFLENEENPNSQLLSAKAGISRLYLNSLVERYKGKPELNYKSFKKITTVNADMQGLLHLIKMQNTDKNLIIQKKKALIKSIDEIIEDFKSSEI